MRFHERCPKCGFLEEQNWRPRFMDTQTDVIEAGEVPELAAKLCPNIPFEDGQWTYYLTRTRKWIYRTQAHIARVDPKIFTRRSARLGNPSGRRAMMAKFNRNLAARKKQTKLFPEKP